MHSPDDQMKTPRHCLFPKSNIRQQSYGPACRLFSRPRHRLCWRSLDRLQILRLGARSASRRIRRTRVRAMNDTRFSSSDERWPLMAALTWIATRSLKFVEQLAFCDPAEAEPFLFEARKISGAPCQISYSDSFYSLDEKIESRASWPTKAWLMVQDRLTGRKLATVRLLYNSRATIARSTTDC
jgi:hypothetical protein